MDPSKEKSGWAYRVNGDAIAEGFGAVELTTSRMLMEVNAITEALLYLQAKQYRRAIIVINSLSTLQKFNRLWANYLFKQT